MISVWISNHCFLQKRLILSLRSHYRYSSIKAEHKTAIAEQASAFKTASIQETASAIAEHKTASIREVRLYINCFYRVIVCIFSVYLFFFLFLSGFLGIPTAIAIMQIHIIRYLFIPLSTDKGDTSVLKKF